MNINKLSLEEKIGQMFLVAYEGNTITDELKALIQDYKIGGIILYRKHFLKYATPKRVKQKQSITIIHKY